MTANAGRSDVGAGGVEVAFAVVALMAMLFFIVGALRVTSTSGDVAAAAPRGGSRGCRAAQHERRSSRRADGRVDDAVVAGCRVPGRTGGGAVGGGVGGWGGLGERDLHGVIGGRRAGRLSRSEDGVGLGCRVRRQCPRERLMINTTKSNGFDDVADRGDVMLMTTVFVVFLMFGAWSLVSAGQQWGARRDAQASAAAAARAAAQVHPNEVRGGSVSLDPAAARVRAQAVLGASGYAGAVSVNGLTVTVVVSRAVDYAFPAPGFDTTVTAEATATASRGVQGDEGG